MNIGQFIIWIIVGGFAGTLAGRVVTFKKEGLGRWVNLLVGMVGAAVGGSLFRLLKVDFGLGELKVTFEDLIAAFLGSLLVIFLWRIIMMLKARQATPGQHPRFQPVCADQFHRLHQALDSIAQKHPIDREMNVGFNTGGIHKHRAQV